MMYTYGADSRLGMLRHHTRFTALALPPPHILAYRRHTPAEPAGRDDGACGRAHDVPDSKRHLRGHSEAPGAPRKGLSHSHFLLLSFSDCLTYAAEFRRCNLGRRRLRAAARRRRTSRALV